MPHAKQANNLPATIKTRPGKPLKTPAPDHGLTDRVKAAIHHIVFHGANRPEAAKSVGLADRSLLAAFAKPAVLRHLREQQQVLKSGEQPRALRRIIDLIDNAKSEKVQLDAAIYLDSDGASAGHAPTSVTVNVTPGYVIDLSDEPAPMIDVTPGHTSDTGNGTKGT